ncbi:MAG: class I SAM-dependent methyltransferase, partial [Gaiellaceae bacterium]
RFMGRFSEPLAVRFVALAQVRPGQRALDVGCGPGALTSELVQRLGASAVVAVDPSEPFVVAARERHPEVDVHQAAAEELPFADGEFDAALAQLVVHFMADPVRGLAEMARVTRAGGVVCACVWDHAGDQSPLSPFWQAVCELEPGADAEANLAGTRGGQLTEFFREAGLREVEETALPVHLEHATFEDWWEPFTLGVGPAGVYLASLDATKQAELREACRRRLPESPFTLSARAWTARGEPAN